MVSALIITISADYLVTKLHAIETYFLTGPRSANYYISIGGGSRGMQSHEVQPLAFCLHRSTINLVFTRGFQSDQGSTPTSFTGVKTTLLLCHYQPRLGKRHIQVI